MVGEDSEVVVSVCLITYNHEKYIAEAIESVLMQEVNFKYEIVVGEDCSTDNTRQILMNYAVRHQGVFNLLLHKKNIGATQNTIAALKACKGKYIALLEGDDYWTDPSKLQKQIDFLENHQSYVITYSSVEAFDENGKVESYTGGLTCDLESIKLQMATPINTPTACFRNVLKEFPPEYQCAKIGDLFIWSLLGGHGKGKYLENITPARYRIHDAGIFSKKTEKEKLLMTHATCFLLYLYYLRIGNASLSSHFYKESVIYGVMANGEYFYLKFLAMKIWISIKKNIISVLMMLKIR